MRGLSERAVRRLDVFEGGEYERVGVRVRVLEGEGEVEVERGGEVGEVEVETETYVWIRGVGGLEGGEWDFEGFRREKMGRWARTGVFRGEYFFFWVRCGAFGGWGVGKG